ncbi:phosphoesterase, PA-phosphatase related protein [Psychromonas ingrahamii 37]|uniref:Phosphoesterase, PA-phosphatase related protein n=1 Tax=Psychromonas ingrahamii (strain DSM 17664 / CCUG 51855 / 37) TaxID=357804 RepID=A1SVZ4_PSYIN|nr:LssY C-terminal domain-containing protein [Psychromonas ingrahamii]ABM03659.1 phosphoesterase, PA-phosphatase related protein [Psychromonas ingrahamii 37]
MNDLINNILPSIEHFKVTGYWIAFFAALLETTLAVGLLFPGSLIILFLGALSARGYLDLGDLIWFSVFGAIIGDNLNYYLGKKYGTKWLKEGFWLLKENHIIKAQHFMNAQGAKSVFLSRFIPGAKELVPFIAGTIRMNKRTFMFWNVLGGIGWGCQWVLAGYLFAQSLNLAELWLSRAGLFFAFMLIFAGSLYLFKYFIIKKGKKFWLIINSLLQSFKEALSNNEQVILWRQKHPRSLVFIQARLDRTAFSGLMLSLLTLVFLYVIALLGGIVEDLITSDPIVAADIRIANLFFVFRDETLTAVFSWITLLGKSQIILVFITVLVVLLWLWRKKDYIFPLFIAVIGSETFTFLGKLAFHRPRPEMAVYVENSFSFPSGHATIAVAFYGFLGYLLIRFTQSWNKKVNIFFTTIILIIAIGFSRIYLGVHYISDVWSGYLVGAMWLIIAISFSEWFKHKNRKQASVPPNKLVRTISFGLILTAILFYLGFAVSYHPPLGEMPLNNTAIVSKSTDIFVNEQLKYTETLIGEKQEPINFIFLAESDDQLLKALQQGGWILTDKANIRSFGKVVNALISKTTYLSAPLSPSFWHAKTQDFSLSKMASEQSFGHSQHIKIWRTNSLLKTGNHIYVGMSNTLDGLRWGLIPKISPDLDTARERLYLDLNRKDIIKNQLKIQLVAPLIGKNFMGDQFFTDGKAYIIDFQ